MVNEKLYAVLTGDLVGSSRYTPATRNTIINHLYEDLNNTREFFSHYVHHWASELLPPEPLFQEPVSWARSIQFYLFRGDSFQIFIPSARAGLAVALFVRTGLLSLSEPGTKRLDARVALGIGRIQQFGQQMEATDGEAFRLSGPALESLEKSRKSKSMRRMVITTPWKDLNDELNVECILLDELMARWTGLQAKAINQRLQGLSQVEIASRLGITQGEVSLKLQRSGFSAVQAFLDRFEAIIPEYYLLTHGREQQA